MSAALVDVLIPVYNGARWLRASLESILHQSHATLRVHVVDDGSTDDTPAILASFAARDPRVRVHRQVNRGIVDALNYGLTFCGATWLARHDADDRADPSRIELQLSYLLSHPDCVAVGALARHVDENDRPLGTITELRPPDRADPSWLPAREPYLMHPFLMVRREALMAVGAYRPVPHAEDSDLYWRLRELGRLHNLDQVLGDYRVHPHSVSSASVVNGRIMAIGSQLAALSARRRAACVQDVDFDALRTAHLREATSLREMIDAVGVQIASAERPAFSLGVAAKLLELADYQPWELTGDDCIFIGGALRSSGTVPMTSGNRRELSRLATRAAVRLHRAGRHRAARLLLAPARLLEFAIRYALDAWLPVPWRRRLHAALRPGRAVAS